MTLNATIKSTVNFQQSASADIETGASQASTTHVLQFADGAGAGQANLQFTDRRTLNASANESLDLSGSLQSLLGSVSFARVKYIEIRAAAANTTNLVVTRPASNGVPFVDAEEQIFPVIRPGGRASWGDPGATGIAVTASTGDLINIANDGAAAATYEIIIIGASS